MTEGPVEALHQNILVILQRERGLRAALTKIAKILSKPAYSFDDCETVFDIAAGALEEFRDPGEEYIKKVESI